MDLRLVMAIAIALSPMQTFADDPHAHGVDGIPDWYDPDCCNLTDCRPVADESTITFGSMEGQTVLIWHQKRPDLPSGEVLFVYTKERWRTSKDGRYHTCSRQTYPLCVYLPPGA